MFSLSPTFAFFSKYSSLEIFHKIVLREWSFRLSFVPNIKQSLGEKGQKAEGIGCSADGDRETPGNDLPRAWNANRGDFPTYSVSRHDLWPADSLCTRSPVLCERFKWQINIKRPFTAPSNKQLDSSFWYAPFLRPLSTLLGVASRVQIFNASTRQPFTLKSSFFFSGLSLFRRDVTNVSYVLENF